jgi:hypothetical protein
MDKDIGTEGQKPEANYEVGYGKPPVASRFPKGQSGNPRGRRKGSLNLSHELEKELKSSVVITDNGRRRKVTKQAVVIRRLVNQAASGDIKAIDLLLKQNTQLEGRASPLESAELTRESDKAVYQTIVQRMHRQLKGGKRENNESD